MPDLQTTHLIVQPHFGVPGTAYRFAYQPGDAFYDRLLAAHRGLSDAASEALNARLVLLLANHIGDLRVLDEALAIARRGLDTLDAPAVAPPTA